MAARSREAQLQEALERVVAGDPISLSLIASADHDELREVAASLGVPLVVSRTAAVEVLMGMNQRTFTTEEAQGWASFVRRGYLATTIGGPVRPLDIAYEQAWEEAIAAVVSRLDEIGDVVDGDVTMGEVLDLLQLLGES